MARRVLLGRIVAVHGVRGLVKIASYTEDPEAIAAYGPLEDEAGNALSLTAKGTSKGLVLAAVAGIGTREAAEGLKGRMLYVPRSRLPDPGEDVYQADLVGLAARDPGGRLLGTVVAVVDFGAGPLLEISPEGDDETVFLPFTQDVVPIVAGDHVTIDAPPGLWPEEGEEAGAS